MPQSYLLDTSVWFWQVTRPDRLPEKWKETIQQAEKERTLYLSVASIWEIANLEVAGKIKLNTSILEWNSTALVHSGVQVIDFNPAIAIASTRIPGNLHPDPVDRIIVATAQSLNAVLLTEDIRIRDYAAQGYVMAEAA